MMSCVMLHAKWHDETGVVEWTWKWLILVIVECMYIVVAVVARENVRENLCGFLLSCGHGSKEACSRDDSSWQFEFVRRKG